MSFSADAYLSSLKPFQLDTVDYVFERFFGDQSTDRFLVADEVGLGKTLVAKGVIAKLIEHHLTHTDERIDIVYVCSNQAIAKQNFAKLAIVGRERRAPDRITTLPLHVHNLNARVRGLGRGVNIVPLTPSTSLDLRSGRGRVDERALLGHMLADERLCGSRKRVWAPRLLAEPADESTYRDWSDRIAHQRVDKGLTTAFVKAVRAKKPLRARLSEVVDAMSSKRKAARAEWIDEGKKLVVDLRRALAESCINALEPDLVILDEFQRFAKIIDPEATGGTAELAQRLFRYPNCKTLLLSATPYPMYTRMEELGDDHHAEFRKTTTFLLGDEHDAEQLDDAFRVYRHGLRLAGDDQEHARRARDEVEGQLRRVMVRTERLGATSDRNGMLDASPGPDLTPVVKTKDLRAYGEVETVAKELGARDVVDWWKSAPYLLNMMDDHYKLAERFVTQARSSKRRVAIRHRLPPEAPHSSRLDPANPRLRGLLGQLDAEASWKLLWIPASLPYYAPRRPFAGVGPITKRLLFSRWQVAPKAVSTLTSNHVERRARAYVARAGYRVEDLADLGQPLGWRAGGTATELALTLPSPRLATLCNPLELAGALGAPGSLPAFADVHRAARRRVAADLRAVGLPRGRGREDPTWYSVAALRLDAVRQPEVMRAWLRAGASAGWLGAHHASLERALDSDHSLGTVPRDLPDVLALRGLASPGVCAYRALERLFPDQDAGTLAEAAGQIGGAFRRMFDLPESIALVRGADGVRRRPYWRAALEYCASGNMSAVLDEYLHVLDEWAEADRDESQVQAVANAADAAVGITAATLEARHITADGKVNRRPIRLRTRFCLRLDDRVEDTKVVQRVDRVRKAFNSPFWPFVLATTSVGQEGLDFHLYSHAVVHWNLPSNPVDLEQREGRVHRYKNHAVRRNLAHAHASAAFADSSCDPWTAVFDSVPEADAGLTPWWVYPGAARIERHVPAEPFSIDRHREAELVRLLGMYRLAFGQPRQEELMAVLDRGGLSPEDAASLTLDLAPPARS